MLRLERLQIGYGGVGVVKGVCIQVGAGEVVLLIGGNASGKSTLLKGVAGLASVMSGGIWLDELELSALPPAKRSHLGIRMCLQDVRVFGSLTVRENLRLGAGDVSAKELARRMGATLERFPSLTTQLGKASGKLSGGEQQLVAIARALMGEPRVLLLDEPTAGLAANRVQEFFSELLGVLRSGAIAVMMAEQRVEEVLPLADSVYLLRDGTSERINAAEASAWAKGLDLR